MVFRNGQSNGVIQFYPRPYLVTMATKFRTIGYNSVCVKDICEIFASIGVVSGMGY